MWKACALIVCIGATAHAESGIAARLADQAAFTPGLSRAEGGGSFINAVTSWSGASDRVQVDATGEAQLVGPVRLVVRVQDAFGETARPGLGVAVQVLDERRHGAAGTAYLQYKTEGFSEPEGELEAVIALGKRLDRVHTLVDAAYGQDPEGAERDGELAIAAQVEARPGLFAGAAVRYRDALGTTKEAIARDGFGGATSTLTVGSLAVTAMVGVAMVETQLRRYGASATVAIGAVF